MRRHAGGIDLTRGRLSATDADRAYKLPSALPTIPDRLPPLPADDIVANEPAVSLKRKADEAELGRASRRAIDADGADDSLDPAASSKRLRVDEATGVIDLDSDEPNGAAAPTTAPGDDGVIELD